MLTPEEAHTLADMVRQLASKIYTEDRCGHTAFELWCQLANGIQQIPQQNGYRPPSRQTKTSA